MFQKIKQWFAVMLPSNKANFVAQQLKQPHGIFAAKVAEGMNESNKNLYQLIANHIQLADGEKLLEIGFGNGYFFKPLLQLNKNIKLYGLEISKEMLQQCSLKNRDLIANKQLEVSLATNDVLPYANDFFNKIIAVNLIYFWADPQQQIRELQRIMKEDATLHIGIRPYEVLSKLPFAKTVFHVEKDTYWINLFEQQGFELMHAHTVAEEDLNFNNQLYKMAGLYWEFKKKSNRNYKIEDEK